MAGPSIAYALDGFTKDNGDKTDINFDHLHRADFGLQFGAGAAFSIDPGKIFLDARYGLGLTNINNASNADDNHWMHRGINLGIGYIHLLNKE